MKNFYFFLIFHYAIFLENYKKLLFFNPYKKLTFRFFKRIEKKFLKMSKINIVSIFSSK